MQLIHICANCRRAKGTVPMFDIVFQTDFFLCKKCDEKQKKEWRELLESTKAPVV